MPTGFVGCQQQSPDPNKKATAYVIGGQQTLLVICSAGLATKNAVGSIIPTFANGVILEDEMTLSVILLHEFVHVFGGPNSTSDGPPFPSLPLSPLTLIIKLLGIH